MYVLLAKPVRRVFVSNVYPYHVHTHTHTHTHTASNRKKRVEVALQEPDMNKLKYEMTYMSETRQSKGFNYFIRRLKRVDLDHSPVCTCTARL